MDAGQIAEYFRQMVRHRVLGGRFVAEELVLNFSWFSILFVPAITGHLLTTMEGAHLDLTQAGVHALEELRKEIRRHMGSFLAHVILFVRSREKSRCGDGFG